MGRRALQPKQLGVKAAVAEQWSARPESTPNLERYCRERGRGRLFSRLVAVGGNCICMARVPTRTVLLLLSLACCGFALDPSLDISQYAHTAFKVRDGFGRGFFLSIAQTPDGYLWLGTDFGLLRFDGVRLVSWQPPPGQRLPGTDIPTLLVTRDGALWIGTVNGLARWKDGTLITWAELSGQRISSLLQDRAGAVWIGSRVGTRAGKLCALQNERIQCQDDIFRSAVRSLYEDSEGNLLVGVNDGVWKVKPGGSAFFALPEDHVEGSIGEDNQSAILVGTQVGIFRLTNGRVEPYRLPGFPQRFRASRILRDRDGGLWIATLDRGLFHYYQGKTDVFSEADGLSGDSVATIFEDREGNIWAATPNGLDRFRGYAIPRIGSKQGLSNTVIESLLAAKDGRVWIATFSGLNKWKDGRISVLGRGAGDAQRGGTFNELTHCLLQDSRGRIWVSTSRETGYLENERFVPVLHLRDAWVYSIAEAPSGHIWIANQNRLLHLFNERVVQNIPWAVLGHKDHARVLLADPSQRGLWLGFAQGGVVYFVDGRVQKSYSAAEGLSRGMVNGLRFGAGGVLWAATAGGLSRIRDGHITTLTSKNGVPCETVHWSMEDDDDSLWLYIACGLVRITRPELDAWVADPATLVKATLFDASDGVRSPSYSSQLYSITKSSDGRIWFAGFDGVSVIDPHRLSFNNLPPPVHIEQTLGDGKQYDIARGLRLPPLVRNLAFDFVALSLVAPEKNRYRFKLDGWDSDWRDAVNEFRMEYTNLPPGRYRFRVVASNNSGVWNETGDTLEFSIDPAYYQTSWFLALCIAAVLAAIWGLYRLRLYQIAREFSAQLDGRVDERMRVARDLHDTLLQTFQAALIQMQAAYNLLSRRPEKAVETLQKAITISAGAIAEGRDAIQNMRASTITKNDLARALRVAGDQMAAQGSATFEVMVQGSSRDVHPILHDEVYRIALEAMRNAFQHAEARAIEADILYGDSLRVRIRDNGKGIDPAVMKEGRSGHYGLLGMRERAERIGGKLDVWTGPGAGTEIQLTIPGTIAFGKSGGASLFRLFQRKSKSEQAAQN